MDQGFTTRTRLQQSQQAVATAEKVLNNAQSDAAKAKAALATGSQVPGVNPQIAAAQAQRDQASLILKRTVVRAPISGRAAETQRLQIGQMAVQGLPLVSHRCQREELGHGQFQGNRPQQDVRRPARRHQA